MLSECNQHIVFLNAPRFHNARGTLSTISLAMSDIETERGESDAKTEDSDPRQAGSTALLFTHSFKSCFQRHAGPQKRLAFTTRMPTLRAKATASKLAGFRVGSIMLRVRGPGAGRAAAVAAAAAAATTTSELLPPLLLLLLLLLLLC